jgi:hypothetical protein
MRGGGRVLVALVLAYWSNASAAETGGDAYTTEEIAQMFAMAEGIAIVASYTLENQLAEGHLSPRELEMLLITVIESNPLIYGSAIAFEPGLYEAIVCPGAQSCAAVLDDGVPDGQGMTAFAPRAADGLSLYCPYGHRANSSIKTMDLAGAYDYTGIDDTLWYTDPKRLFLQGVSALDSTCREEDRVLNRTFDGSAMAPCFWTKVYFDEGAGNIYMSTFSAPFRTTIDMSSLGETYDGIAARPDADGMWFGGVVTIDMSLEHINQRSCPADLCSSCLAGKQPTADETGCAPCSGNTYSIFGVCQPCRGTAVEDNGLFTQCQPCSVGKRYSERNVGCVCMPGWYLYSKNASTDKTLGGGLEVPIVCHESEYETSILPSPGCTQCGACAECSTGSEFGAPNVSAGYVQVLAGEHTFPAIHVFKCIYDKGCFSNNEINTTTAGCKTCPDKTLPLTMACKDTYTGHFCSQCADDYELRRANEADPKRYECMRCGVQAKTSTITVAGAFIGMVIVFVMRGKILHSLAIAPARMVLMKAVARSIWDPFRIIITYGQIAGELSMVLKFAAPKMISEVLASLSKAISVIDVLASAKCLGVDTFHSKWQLQVVYIPMAMMLIPIVLWLVERKEDAVDALKSLTSRSFFVIFFCFPRICQYTFDVFIIHRVSPIVNVLVADDRVLYEDDAHQPYIYLSVLVIAAFSFGVPLGAAALLFREYRRLPCVEPALQARVSEAFHIRIDEAEAAANDIAMGDKWGFLTAAYQPKFYANESLDMLRKLVLVGLILLVDRGSVAQAMTSLCLAVFFLSLQMKNWPYKNDWDNKLRVMTEAHVCLTIAVALAFCSDLDSTAGFGDDDHEIEALKTEMSRKKNLYDWLLVLTFILCVPGALLVTMTAKIRLVMRALQRVPNGACERDANIKSAFERSRLGVASAADLHELKEYLEAMRIEVASAKFAQVLNGTQWAAKNTGLAAVGSVVKADSDTSDMSDTDDEAAVSYQQDPLIVAEEEEVAESSTADADTEPPDGNSYYDKFTGGFEGSFANMNDFFGGLEKMIGECQKDLVTAMEEEHCAVAAGYGASDETFVTSSYQVTSTPREEWHFVVAPAAVGDMDAGTDRETGHSRGNRVKIPVEKLLEQAAELMTRSFADRGFGCVVTSDDISRVQLRIEEVIALRLYTGPSKSSTQQPTSCL